MSNGRRSGPLALVAVAVALVAASAASAGGPINPAPGDKQLGTAGGLAYVSDPERTDNNNFAASYAACPKVGHKWRLTGGGITTGAAIPAITDSLAQDLSPVFGDNDPIQDDYWRTLVTSSGPGTKFVSFAICAKLKGLTYEAVDVPPGLVTPLSVTDPCPGRSEPVGGGGSTGFSVNPIASMYPDGSEWTFVVDGTIDPGDFATNNFVCGSPKDIRTVTETAKVPALGAKSATAMCPGRSHVTGGGVELRFPTLGDVFASFPIDDGDKGRTPDDGWRAGIQSTGMVQQTERIYAICRK